MAVIKQAERRMLADYDIRVTSSAHSVHMTQPSLSGFHTVIITSRTDADDLIIALMLARDTLWPISTGVSDGD